MRNALRLGFWIAVWVIILTVVLGWLALLYRFVLPLVGK